MHRRPHPWWGRAVGAAAVASLGLGLPARSWAQPAESVVVVVGDAVVRVAPDTAWFDVTTEARRRSPRDAQREAAAAMADVRGRLVQAGLTDSAFQTRAYAVAPEFDIVDGRRVLRGYVARHTLEVRVDDLARVGELLDLAVGAGAAAVGDVQFERRDRQAVERQALQAAVADALARAHAAAAGAGRAVDRVVRIDESGAPGPPPVPVLAARAAAAEAATPPIAPGTIEVRARVTLTAVLR
jgi:uncharacterized protein YggE